MASTYKLVIFDWEGTLQDSKGMLLAALKEHVEANSLVEFDEGYAREHFSYDPTQLIDFLYQNSLSAKERVALKLSFQQHYLSKPKKPFLFKGAEELLASLNAKGKFVAIATNASWQGMDNALSALEIKKQFFAIKTADDHAQKPSPEMIEALLTESGVRPEQAVMIGDSGSDIKAALHANIDAIGFAQGCDEALLQHQGAKTIAHSMAELAKLLL